MLNDLLIDEQLAEAISSMNIEKLTSVQEIVIPMLLEGHDVVVNAKTGSGKTMTYVVPMLQQILDNPKPDTALRTQALVLAPTRELCRQINKQITLLAEHTAIQACVIIGGEDPKYQIMNIRKHPDIIIATPGRLIQHIDRGVIDLDSINILVIDEADRMLDMGFSEDVISIAKMCSHECQTSLFSASFSEKRFSALMETIMVDPEIVLIDLPGDNQQNIKQQKICIDSQETRYPLTVYLANQNPSGKTLIFTNKKSTAEKVFAYLKTNGIQATLLHGDIEQKIRNQQLRDFRNNPSSVIVATDVASRGIDVNDLNLVINFDIPKNAHDYIHRIGRTGRMEQPGTAISLVDADSWNSLVGIENYLGNSCQLLKLEQFPSRFNGADNLKSSGKRKGKKRKPGMKQKAKSTIKKSKDRLRDRKNIGKRRQPKSGS
jgi:ATP-dependent RNA helicase SrmB